MATLPAVAESSVQTPVPAGLSGEDFAALFKSRERARSAHFSLHWRTSPVGLPRLGMVVAKRLTRTAVRRNLIKRQARALFALAHAAHTQNGASAEVLARDPVPRDVVLRLTRNPRALARAEQYAELQGLFSALAGPTVVATPGDPPGAA